jgi:acyl CoA:acetate/3-ketoacid CoA transferase alpha subunit
MNNRRNGCCGDVQDGATIMVGGFGLCGIPENLTRLPPQRGKEPHDRE